MGYYNDASLGTTADDAEQDRRDGLFAPADLIFSYTRAQAIADGVLIDVTATAREAGFVVPVAVTAALWADIAAIPAGNEDLATDRLWRVLWRAYGAICRAGAHVSAVDVTALLPHPTAAAEQCRFRAVCGPGDVGEPVITLMRMGED